MFKFLIKSRFGQLIATINAEWNDKAQVHFDTPNTILIEDFIERNGMSADGYRASLPSMRPCDFHYTFVSPDAVKEGYELQVLEGQTEYYETSQNEMLEKLEIIPFDENIFDDAEGEQLKLKEQSFTLQGRYQFQGLPISVENKAGSKREGIDPDGHKWSVPMHFDYGYIRSTNGADNEGIDCYVGKNRKAEHVYIIKQHKIEKVKKWRNGACPKCREHVHDCACEEFFDEDKVMLGFDNKEQAKAAYLKQYDNELFLGPISTMTISNFKKAILAARGKKLTLPLRFVHDSVFDAEQEDIDAILAAKNMDELESVFYSIFQETDENVTFGLKKGGVKTREKINKEAKAIVAKVQALDWDSSSLTEDELDLLRQYSGRGGLTENSQFEYFTPTYIAEACWDILSENGFVNGNVLEPSAGAGVFNHTKKQGVFMTATEIDPTSSGVNKILHPEDNIFNQSFEKLAVESPDDHFDSVIGNVPFGDERGASVYDDPAHKNEKLIERYFINRLIDKVKPGGLIVLVTPVNIVRQKGDDWSKWRTKISKKAEFLGAHKLPSKTFGKQGTSVVTDIIVLKKHSKEAIEKIAELNIDQLRENKVVWETFIDGKWWEKDGKPFIQGRFVPKDASKIRDDDKVIRDDTVTDATLKKKLAMKFHSRINWDALDLIEPVTKNYIEGDRRVIDERTYEFVNGKWEPYVSAEVTTKIGIDAELFGAASVQELKALLETNEGALSLSLSQAKASLDAFKHLFSESQKAAVEFAMHQPSEKYQEQIYRGTLIGAEIAKFQNSVETGEWNPVEQARLQDLIQKDVDKYGHPKQNKGLQLAGDKSRYFGMFSAAMDEEGNFSILLTGETVSNKALAFNDTDLQSIVEFLVHREGLSDLTLEDLQKIYKGKPALKSLSDIADNKNLAIDNDGYIMPMAKFCSGDVYDKILSLSVAIKNETDHKLKAKYQQQLEEIDKRRHKTPTDKISFSMLHKWIDRKYILEFLHEKGYDRFDYVVEKDVVKVDEDTGESYVKTEKVRDTNSPFGEFVGYGGKDATGGNFYTQLNRWINGNNLTATENKKDQLDLIKKMEGDFRLWIQQHQDADALTELYNNKFNSFIDYEHSKDDLGLTNVSAMVKPHWYQNAAVRRLSVDGTGILGFDVGLGKTFSALALAKYNHQTNRANKTLIVVPNSVLANWYHETKLFHGNLDHALFVGFKPQRDKKGNIKQEFVKDEKGNPKKNEHTQEIMYQDALKKETSTEIYEKMHEIPHTSKTLVIMTYEKFKAIPMRSMNKKKYADKWVDKSLISDQVAVDTIAGTTKVGKKQVSNVHLGTGKKDKISYQEAVRKGKLERYFLDDGGHKKGEYPYFEEMGFKSVIVDEAHNFKNSFKAGEKTQNIKFLANPKESQRAIDMAMKMNWLRENNNDKGPVLLTATPVTNSPLEIFNMLSLIIPVDEFEKFGVYTADDFVRVFGQISSEMQMKVSGDFGLTDTLTGFQNLDGLRNLFTRYSLIQNAEDVKLPLPEAVQEISDVDLDEDQAAAYAVLKKEAQAARKKEKSSRSLFAIMRDMDKATADMDLYNNQMTFVFPGTQLNAIQQLVDSLPATVKGAEKTELDEMGEEVKVKKDVDLEYTLEKDGNSAVLVVPDVYEHYVTDRFKEYGIKSLDVSHPIAPKYAKLLANLRKELEAEGKQIIFTEEKTQHHKLKRIIAHSMQDMLTENEIGIINGTDAAGEKLQQIADAYNSSSIKIVICNKKAEVGVNLNKGTTAIHHLTYPWTPASMQQRNGRGVRQGNKKERVTLYNYVANKSFDMYRLNLLNGKANWIGQILNGTETEAANNGGFDENDYHDAFENDPEAAKARRLEKLAKEQAIAAEKKRQQCSILLSQVIAARAQLAAWDKNKASSLEELIEKRNKLQDTLAKQKEKGDKGTSKNEQALARTQMAINEHDEVWSINKAKVEKNLKMRLFDLKQRAELNQLPFDAALIENSDNVLVASNGVVFELHATYETAEGEIIKIESINTEDRTLIYSEVFGEVSRRWWGEYDYSEKKYIASLVKVPEGLKRVSVSQEEIEVKKILIATYDYKDLGKINKEMFDKYRDQLKLRDVSYYYYLYRDAQGVFSIATKRENLDELVYPDKENTELKKSLAEYYFATIREQKTTYGFNDIMSAFWGSSWQMSIEEYGATATQSDVLAVCANAWGEHKKELLNQISTSQYHKDKDQDIAMLDAWKANKPSFERELENSTKKLADNTKTIKSWVREYVDSLEQQIKDGALKAEDRIKNEELAKIKEDPRYKEVPEQVRSAFAKLGITAKYNNKDVNIPDNGRYRGFTIPAFSTFFLQDENGKRGALMAAKDTLKARHGAKYCIGDGEYSGSWWYFSSNVDLAKIYEVIADAA